MKYPFIGDVRGKGLLLGIEMVKDRVTKEPATAECAAVLERARELGLLLGRGGLWGQTIRVAPPMCIKAGGRGFHRGGVRRGICGPRREIIPSQRNRYRNDFSGGGSSSDRSNFRQRLDQLSLHSATQPTGRKKIGRLLFRVLHFTFRISIRTLSLHMMSRPEFRSEPSVWAAVGVEIA
jgi:hypothetical protein